MSSILERFRLGQRCWPAECGLRSVGIALLAACGKMLVLAHRMISAPPSHQTTFAEFGLCAVAFFLLTSGLAFTLEGPGLFRWVPIPTRSLIS